MKKPSTMRIVAVVAMLSAAAGAAAAPASAPEAQIPFAKHDIWRWQVVDDTTVLIQDLGRRWYKATLFGTCVLRSLVATGAPPKKAKANTPDPAPAQL
jgi:hypothetical protein